MRLAHDELGHNELTQTYAILEDFVIRKVSNLLYINMHDNARLVSKNQANS